MDISNLKCIGTAENLQEIVKREGVDKVVVALPDRRGKLPMETLLTCKLQGVDIATTELDCLFAGLYDLPPGAPLQAVLGSLPVGYRTCTRHACADDDSSTD
jgi:hypothetical protein